MGCYDKHGPYGCCYRSYCCTDYTNWRKEIVVKYSVSVTTLNSKRTVDGVTKAQLDSFLASWTSTSVAPITLSGDNGSFTAKANAIVEVLAVKTQG